MNYALVALNDYRQVIRDDNAPNVASKVGWSRQFGGVSTAGQWIDVGTSTIYEFSNLDDVWYSVNVKVVDRSVNTYTSTVGFGIYTSIWSENGPYNGIPLYALTVAIIAVVILSVLLYWRNRKGGPAVASVPKEEPAPEPL